MTKHSNVLIYRFNDPEKKTWPNISQPQVSHFKELGPLILIVLLILIIVWNLETHFHHITCVVLNCTCVKHCEAVVGCELINNNKRDGYTQREGGRYFFAEEGLGAELFGADLLNRLSSQNKRMGRISNLMKYRKKNVLTSTSLHFPFLGTIRTYWEVKSRWFDMDGVTV